QSNIYNDRFDDSNPDNHNRHHNHSLTSITFDTLDNPFHVAYYQPPTATHQQYTTGDKCQYSLIISTLPVIFDILGSLNNLQISST
ncbi:hypothetical protein V5O48_016149, partial [Marasmius crinis-equi]